MNVIVDVNECSRCQDRCQWTSFQNPEWIPEMKVITVERNDKHPFPRIMGVDIFHTFSWATNLLRM
jgi:hypothetical protein